MHQTTTQRRGTSTSRSTKEPNEATKRDARITTCGLLNHIIAAQSPPEEWAALLCHALNVHQYGTKRVLGMSASEPKWEK